MTDAEAAILAELQALRVEVTGLWAVVKQGRVKHSVGRPANEFAECSDSAAWLTVDDVAQITRLSPETVQDRARRGLIPMFKDGREWKITPRGFAAYERRAERGGLSREARYPRRH